MSFYLSCLLAVAAVSAAQWIEPWDIIFDHHQLFPGINFIPQQQGQTRPEQQPQQVEPQQSCDCGWVNRGRIVGGHETGRNEYPPMVALQETRTMKQFCGGTILTRWHIVTAAHCTDGKSPREIRINVGAHNVNRVESNSRIHTLSSIIQHENYDRVNVNNDIALLIVSSPITFSSVVGPACLPRERIDLVGQVVKALGWGFTKNKGVSSDVLREVDLPVISMKECRKLWRMSGQSGPALPQRSINICTDHPKKDTCQGDSGGPLIWLDPRSNRYTIVALVSYGSDCGGILPGVNTDVGAFLTWINSKIEETRPGVKACSLA